jgi:hypothetical protein
VDGLNLTLHGEFPGEVMAFPDTRVSLR